MQFKNAVNIAYLFLFFIPITSHPLFCQEPPVHLGELSITITNPSQSRVVTVTAEGSVWGSRYENHTFTDDYNTMKDSAAQCGFEFVDRGSKNWIAEWR